jgi:DNA-binding transcriptional MerR regulator
MGLDIGFTLYEKKPLEKEGKFVCATINESTDNWMCGWGGPNESWGKLFEFNDTEYVTPVFQEEITKHPQVLEEFKESYKLVDFDLFADYVHEACTDEYHEANEQRNEIYRRMAEANATIKELRELQKGCTEENAFAFDRWAFEISELKDKIKDLDERLKEDDFGYEYQAKAVNAMLEKMKKYLDEDKYYIVPYFSC